MKSLVSDGDVASGWVIFRNALAMSREVTCMEDELLERCIPDTRSGPVATRESNEGMILNNGNSKYGQ